MVVAGQDRCLPLEPGQSIRVVGERVQQDLQRELARELGVAGLPELAHAALTEEHSHVVVHVAADPLSGRTAQLPQNAATVVYGVVDGSGLAVPFDGPPAE